MQTVTRKIFRIAIATVCLGLLSTNLSAQINLNEKVVDLSGKELIDAESVNIRCETIVGDGRIEAPNVEIVTETFAFKGTICCSNQCVIETDHKFDSEIFTQAGGGEFVYVLHPQDEEIGE